MDRLVRGTISQETTLLSSHISATNHQTDGYIPAIMLCGSRFVSFFCVDGPAISSAGF